MTRTPTFKDLMKHPVLFLGFGLGSGLSSKAPGTVGTLFGGLIFLPLMLWSQEIAWALTIVGLLLGSRICGQSADWSGVHDHGGIVWDEFVAMWLVLLCLPEQNWQYWLLAFVTFRFFDIVKPWPISWADRKVAGGLGIMLDDIIAACYSIIIIWAVFRLFA
ncbi:phosphatidylglycerophosphatase A [Hydrogenovibrio sp. JE_KL2]|jgi:phosphatidylglycerophosphatase A|uniref:phosphatidylglycerophosphatase A family protein n=1 Tax=Hydrogenovibrio sp. JE_KL2 TaxID=2651188 RepID=UPI00128C2A43|nr:phosphatidylglycerophosphatase A [Hydrogenovibrio sp. JE_KL2]MPQ75738.1 phosphatidylglycerophosphatase A [Hydrogenovibrio sp. JE_KL2]